MDLKSKANSYEAFVKEIAVDFPQFKALVAFLNAPKLNLALSKTPAFLSGPATTKDDIISDSETDSTFSCPSLPSRRPSNRSIITHHITRLQFNPNEAAAIATSVDLDKLEKALSEQGIGNQLFIVNDLSPRAVRLFGGYWNIDPQFFLDYIDVLPKDNARANERGIRPAPWFRHEDIEHHLPMLRSMDAERQHVTIRYVGPREHRTEDENAPSVRLGSRGILHPGFDNCYIQRGGGGLDPIYPEHKSFWKWLSATLKLARRDPLSDEKDFPKLWPVSMVRNSAATWFGKENSGQWKNGIILLDPPAKYNQDLLKKLHSKYRAFSSHPMPDREHNPVDARVSYANTVFHCLTSINGIPSPLTILQPIYRIMASEWIVVTAYLERDLNALEWRFEHTTPDDLALEFFLKQLSIMRRWARKYEALVND